MTSRETGRWVLPKGWPMKLRRPHQAAAIEAYEEAGVRGHALKTALGSYEYDKRLESGAVRCRVRVFPMKVERLEEDWPEKTQRHRRWFSPLDAAERVDEPELRALLRDFAELAPMAGDGTTPPSAPLKEAKGGRAKPAKKATGKKSAPKASLKAAEKLTAQTAPTEPGAAPKPPKPAKPERSKTPKKAAAKKAAAGAAANDEPKAEAPKKAAGKKKAKSAETAVIAKLIAKSVVKATRKLVHRLKGANGKASAKKSGRNAGVLSPA